MLRQALRPVFRRSISTGLPPISIESTRMSYADIIDDDGSGRWVNHGPILERMDVLGFAISAKLTKGPTATVSLDQVRSHRPVFHGDLFRLEGQVLNASRSATAIQITGYRLDVLTGDIQHTHDAIITLVAIDEKGRPRPSVPPMTSDVDPTMMEDRAEKAMQRKELGSQWNAVQEEVDNLPRITTDMLQEFELTKYRKAFVPIRDTLVEVQNWFMPKHLNNNNTIFGGDLLQWMDKVAGFCAKKFCKSTNIATISMNRINFKFPVTTEDIVSMRAHVVSVRRHTLEVEVEVFIERMGSGEKKKSHSGYFTCVNLDAAQRPTFIKTGIEVDEADQEGMQYLLKAQKRWEFDVAGHHLHQFPPLPLSNNQATGEESLRGKWMNQGPILERMDVVAATVAAKVANGPVATVSFDQVDSHKPVCHGDLFRLEGRVLSTNNSSTAIQLSGYAEEMLTGKITHTHDAIITFVAIDGKGKPRPGLPTVTSETNSDLVKFLAEKAVKRKELATEWRKYQDDVDAMAHISDDLLQEYPTPETRESFVPVRDTLVEVKNWFMPKHLNMNNTIFGGEILQWMDKVAVFCARKFAQNVNMATISMNRIVFKLPITTSDIVSMKSRIVMVRRHTLEVEVEVFIERVGQENSKRKSHTGYFTVINLNENQKRTPLTRGLAVDENDQESMLLIMLSTEEWATALVPLWKEYFLSDEEIDLVKADSLTPLLQFQEILRSCRQPGGFLEQYDLLSVKVVVIVAKNLFSLFGDDALECFIVGYDHYLRSLGLALCMLRHEEEILASEYDMAPRNKLDMNHEKINVRIIGIEPDCQIGELKANVVDTFVSVTGTVIRVNAIKPLVVWCEFLCEKCEGVTPRYFEDGKYDPPPACSVCKSKSALVPHRSSALKVIRIQEVDNCDAAAGRIPRMVEVELTEDLVDSCVPGSIVTICGAVKAMNSEIHGGRYGKQAQSSSLYMLYIVANSVVCVNQSEGSATQENIEFTAEDLDAIYKIAHMDRIFDRFIHSFCPGIYRNELVKAGLLLALFGGAQRKDEGGFTRSDSHVLMVGDPGLGKSQMLRAVSMVTPRGIYVGGNTTTTTGLTVTMVKDSSGDYALEAGALVLADQGVCCIDEFDKMGIDYQALLEAMEQQSISIAKAGIVCNLNARTSVIAAANPAGGHYNRSRSVSENLKMKAALLSRFDLIFVLLDRPDSNRDEMLSNHVMSNHLTTKQKRQRIELGQRSQKWSQQMENTNAQDGSLKARLISNWTELQEELISFYHIRRYIAYARKYIHPKLSPEAKTFLQEKYLKMRTDAEASSEGIPITMRQLESLIRLAQARAKVELKEIVDVQHAYDVVEIMQECLLDTYTTEDGDLDFGRSGGLSLSKKVKGYMARLKKAAITRNSKQFTFDELLDVANSIALQVDDFRGFIDILREECYVLKQGPNIYKIISKMNNHLLMQRELLNEIIVYQNGYTQDSLGVLRLLNESYSKNKRCFLTKPADCNEVISTWVKKRGNSGLEQLKKYHSLLELFALVNGNLTIIKYLHQNDLFTVGEMQWNLAIKHNHFNLVEYLWTYWPKRDTPLMLSEASRWGHLPLVEFFHHNGANATHVLYCACIYGHVEVAEYAYRHNLGEWYASIAETIACKGDLKLLEFIHQSGYPGVTSYLLVIAAQWGHLDMVKYIYEHDLRGHFDDALFMAAWQKHRAIVNYLRSKLPNSAPRIPSDPRFTKAIQQYIQNEAT
ncbi:DNA replication licensing factor MCM8 [Thraustotheca clavata]|uniref:DNA helicase n=1 Tax=Thraustotheca clavata TaxID=74557 RepID=A0A1W0A9A2_9STRA|nr:DNA replication licensing factor MCM8 [Thraustotheca clavata]